MNVKQIKEKYTCLDWLGDRVVRKTREGWLARCPWREDKHPSLSITANGRGWMDYATGEHGSIIDLVMKCLNTTDLARVCAVFDKESFSLFNQSKASEHLKIENAYDFVFCDILPLRSRGLYAYLSERRINPAIAKQFLQEAHYSFQQREDGRYLFALAYPNDKGGFELRNKLFKGGTSPKAITTHMSIEGAPVVVFEGFFDMLSFATLSGGVKHNYIVLNSIVNVPAAIEYLSGHGEKIYLCLDNDEGGNYATIQMLDALPTAVDIRRRFAPHKDVNDYLCSLRKQS